MKNVKNESTPNPGSGTKSKLLKDEKFIVETIDDESVYFIINSKRKGNKDGKYELWPYGIRETLYRQAVNVCRIETKLSNKAERWIKEFMDDGDMTNDQKVEASINQVIIMLKKQHIRPTPFNVKRKLEEMGVPIDLWYGGVEGSKQFRQLVDPFLRESIEQILLSTPRGAELVAQEYFGGYGKEKANTQIINLQIDIPQNNTKGLEFDTIDNSETDNGE